MHRPRLLLLAMACLAFACSPKEVLPPSPLLPAPSAKQLAWHELEQYAFIHFTTNTFTDKEWGFGDEPETVFNPSQLDARQWARIVKMAGLKGIILTTKHHDGFCLWPSEYTEHSIKNSPFRNGKGDLVREVSEACKEYGLKFGVYLSPWDRNHADYGSPAYVDYYRKQLRELFTHYGPIFEMWFDGANGGDGYYGGANEARKIDGSTYYDWPTTLALVREMEPNVLFFSDAGPDIRWVGNEKGIAGPTNWNAITPDTLFAGKAGIESLLNSGSEDGTHWIPAEVDVSIRPGWFYHQAQDSLVKTPEDLFRIYLSSVGRGSNLLLNLPPDRRGLIHERDSASLMGWKALIDQAFAHNLATQAEIFASNVRGNSAEFAASQLLDDDPATYWATDD
ncbi:MAG: alpha-L-fucosidase, partial [Bacteroidia bacterium]|nr:alpha-L-fucosidase [Bacteroidia bacterium]